MTRPLVAASLCVWTVLETQHTRGAEFQATDSGAVADAGSRPSEPRLAALPPIDFNLEQDDYASEPVSDADPAPAAVRPGRRGEFGASAPFSMGGFWAPPTRVSGQDATFGMNAEFARLGIALGIPAEDRPLSVGIAKFGRLELATDARLPDSGDAVPGQFWLVEAGVMHLRPLDGSLPGGGTLGGTFLFGSASDRPFAAGFERTHGGGFSFEILASYLFDRTLFQGTSFSSGRTDVVTFEPGLGLSAQVLWRR